MRPIKSRLKNNERIKESDANIPLKSALKALNKNFMAVYKVEVC
jgi:hypothetical protein